MHFSVQVRKPLFDIKLNEALTHLGNKPSKEFFRRKGCNGNAHPFSQSTLYVSVDASLPFRNKKNIDRLVWFFSEVSHFWLTISVGSVKIEQMGGSKVKTQLSLYQTPPSNAHVINGNAISSERSFCTSTFDSLCSDRGRIFNTHHGSWPNLSWQTLVQGVFNRCECFGSLRANTSSVCIL